MEYSKESKKMVDSQTLFMKPASPQNKDITKKENHRPILLMNIDAKNPKKNSGKPLPAIH